jgi:hypothetical protein
VIVVHREARGGWDATVGVRSERGGQVAYWSFDGDLATETDLDVASDAALTFAESLGFVFDDATLGGGEEAETCWRAWLAGEASALAPTAGPNADPRAARSGAAELELGAEAEVLELELVELAQDDVAKSSRGAEAAPRAVSEAVVGAAASPGSSPPAATKPPETAPDLPPTPTPPRAPPPPEAPALAPRTLSKFRPREVAAPAAPSAAAPARKDAKTARQPLARLQLVKRRSPEEERRLLLRKLLTSF